MPDVGRIGIWSAELRHGDPTEAGKAAAELEELGYGALWLPGEAGGDLLGYLDALLQATSKTTIASGILNIWMHDAKDVAAWRRLGFSEDDIATGSDKLIDALFAWGDEDKIAKRVQAHFAAGADHVCLQVVAPARNNIGVTMPIWRRLAEAVF